MSDLHLNHKTWIAPDVPADVVMLAGDVTNGVEGIRWARDVFKDASIVYVAGNQECYGHNIDRLIPQLRTVARECDVHFLEQDVLYMNGVRILGATLWTDFNLFGNSALWFGSDEVRSNRPVDRKAIQNDTGIFTHAAKAGRHQSTVKWLKSELERDFDGRTVVMTHHLPSMLGLPPMWRDDRSSAAFASHLDDLFPLVDVWICGHTHTAADFRAGRCRVVVNPRGRTAAGHNGFNPGLVIEV